MLEYDQNNGVGGAGNENCNHLNEINQGQITTNTSSSSTVVTEDNSACFKELPNLKESKLSSVSSTWSTTVPIDENIELTDEMSSMVDHFIKLYEEKMYNHIYEQPHTPPTMFELRFRHQIIKENILKSFEKQLMQTLILQDDNDNELKQDTNENELDKQTRTKQKLIDYLDCQLEGLLDNFIDLSAKEYKMCQTAFIIGWKDKNKKYQQNLNQVEEQQQNQNQHWTNGHLLNLMNQF